MSIAQEISRIQSDKSKIAIKLSTMGLAEQTANLTTLANAIDGIDVHTEINATVVEGNTYTIPRGYHNGSGIVTGLNNDAADETKFKLQAKTVTPTKIEQTVSPDQGNYGLSSVTVNPIPAAYQDVTQVDATAANVLAGKKIVAADGTVVVGEMPNNGRIDKTLDTINYWWSIPRGYHDGKGGVSIVGLPVEATPSKEEQYITPEEGTVIDAVTINPIPDNYVDTSSGDATAAHILKDKKAWVDGSEVTGTMHSHGTLQGTIDGLTHTSFTSLTPGYVSEISIRLTDDIENALKEI